MSGTREGWIDLTGQVAVITGAASGIGAAAACEIAAAGATIIGVDRSKTALDETVATIEAAKGTGHAHTMDITDAAAWKNLAETIAAQFGQLDILVNAAGIARFDKVDAQMFDNYREVFAVNVEGSLLGMSTALEFMREAGKGAIVNVSSCASLKGNPPMANYGASKAAISHFTRSAALEVIRAGHDIRINALLPGFVDSAMGDSIHQQFDEKLGGREGTLAVFSSGRAGTPQEMANVILFLVSDRASFVSGSTWVADRAQSA